MFPQLRYTTLVQADREREYDVKKYVGLKTLVRYYSASERSIYPFVRNANMLLRVEFQPDRYYSYISDISLSELIRDVTK